MSLTVGLVKALTLIDLDASVYIPYIFKAYNEVYLNRPMSDIFAQPYATLIEDGLFNGGYSVEEALELLPATISPIFNPSFLNRFAAGNERDLESALKENTLITNQWIPKADLQLAHGKDDATVFYFNSFNLFHHLKDKGKENVDFEIYPNADHAEGRRLWFSSLNEFLENY